MSGVQQNFGISNFGISNLGYIELLTPVFWGSI